MALLAAVKRQVPRLFARDDQLKRKDSRPWKVFQENVVRSGEPVAPNRCVTRDQSIERIPGEGKVGGTRHDVAYPTVVDAKAPVVADSLFPVAFRDAHLPRFEQESNLQKAHGRNKKRLSGSDQTFHAAMSSKQPDDRVGIEKDHFRALKVTPPREDDSNVHCPRSTAGSTHSSVTAALGAFFRGPATESR
jgi:hypothetical protein